MNDWLTSFYLPKTKKSFYYKINKHELEIFIFATGGNKNKKLLNKSLMHFKWQKDINI